MKCNNFRWCFAFKRQFSAFSLYAKTIFDSLFLDGEIESWCICEFNGIFIPEWISSFISWAYRYEIFFFCLFV